MHSLAIAHASNEQTLLLGSGDDILPLRNQNLSGQNRNARQAGARTVADGIGTDHRHVDAHVLLRLGALDQNAARSRPVSPQRGSTSGRCLPRPRSR